MDYQTTIAGNTTGSGVKIAAPDAIRHDRWFATIFTTGTFGGATVAYFLSPDNGTTLVPAKTDAGVAYTTAIADAQNITTGFSRNAINKISLWAQVTGGTANTINITVFDNA